MDFTQFTSPILLRGDAHTAYRDPAVYYQNGTFYLYFTLVETENDGTPYLYLAMTTSRDLLHFSGVKKLSPRDRAINLSSPGNVLKVRNEYILCCQTYCRENGEKYGNANSRVFIIRSKDLLHWSEPELLRVKGDDVSRENMGRMIDPYLVEDAKTPGQYWCFLKQNGVSFARSSDLRHWEFCGHTESGENVCILPVNGRYHLWHSPKNGIGELVSDDLIHWEDTGKLITLGQKEWPWAQGRLTAAALLDLRCELAVGKVLMFFHGTGPEDEETIFDQYASIGLAWSDDFNHWEYAK